MPRNNWVKALGLDADGTLFVEIEDGLRLFDQCLRNPLPAAINIRPEELMSSANRFLYYRFLAALNEIDSVLIHGLYEGSYHFKPGDIVVDAGARIGTFAVKVSRAVGKEGRVIAIEPEPRNFACLLKNVQANHLTNVIPVQKLLWSEPRSLKLYLSRNGASHSVFCDSFYDSTGEAITVEAQDLDSIVKHLGIDSVDFVKMDIEGAEVQAMSGMRDTLNSNVRLAIAAYHPVDGKQTHLSIVPQLEQAGFAAGCAEGIVRARRTSLID